MDRREKQTREENAQKANQKALEIEELKKSGALLSKIKGAERLMILYQRNSYPKDSDEWRLMDQKLQSMEGQIQAALEEERKKELENCYQNLYQAEAKGDKHQIMIWKAIIAKLESNNDVKNKE